MSKNNKNRVDIDVERVPKDSNTGTVTGSNPNVLNSSSPSNTSASKPTTSTPVKPVRPVGVPVHNAVEPQVQEILTNRTTTLKDKLYAISKLSTQCGELAKKLIDYEEKMGNNVKDIDVKIGASNNVSLYNTINKVIHTAGGLEFNQKFQIVNIAFLVFKDSAYSIFKLNRFDFQWQYGQTNLQTYRNLVMLITELADISTRQERVKRIAWSRIFAAKGFRAIAKNNLKRFYEM